MTCQWIYKWIQTLSKFLTVVISDVSFLIKFFYILNQNLKVELDSCLRELSDLRVQCGQLMVSESRGPPEDQLNQRLGDLHSAMTDFRNSVSAKEVRMKDQLTMSERNKRQVEEVMQNTEDLRKWFEDSRNARFTPMISSDGSSSASLSELNFQEVNCLCVLNLISVSLWFAF